MAKAAEHSELKAAFRKHLEETREQLDRLNRILADLGKTPGRKVCEATAGLVKEGSGLIDDAADGEVCDAGLIAAAQKVEHYEIACYGCLHAWASILGRGADVALLKKSLVEERATDNALTALANSVVNADAAA